MVLSSCVILMRSAKRDALRIVQLTMAFQLSALSWALGLFLQGGMFEMALMFKLCAFLIAMMMGTVFLKIGLNPAIDLGDLARLDSIYVWFVRANILVAIVYVGVFASLLSTCRTDSATFNLIMASNELFSGCIHLPLLTGIIALFSFKLEMTIKQACTVATNSESKIRLEYMAHKIHISLRFIIIIMFVQIAISIVPGVIWFSLGYFPENWIISAVEVSVISLFSLSNIFFIARVPIGMLF